jgi:hypothetical protein
MNLYYFNIVIVVIIVILLISLTINQNNKINRLINQENMTSTDAVVGINNLVNTSPTNSIFATVSDGIKSLYTTTTILSGDADIKGNTTMLGDASIKGNTIMLGDAIIKRNTYISGTLHVANIIVSPTASLSFLPAGIVVAWSKLTIPDGWAVCDGTNDTPDLRGRFVLGATITTSKLAQGLSPRKLGDNKLGPTGGEESHTLLKNEMPTHKHTNTFYQSGLKRDGRPTEGQIIPRLDQGGELKTDTSTEGNDTPHNNMPPFYVLVYIMKL